MFDGLVVAYILNFVSHTGCLADFFFAIGLGTQQLLSSKKAGCLKIMPRNAKERMEQSVMKLNGVK